MKTAGVYFRVSSEGQEKEGTSLQTQMEACLKYCQDKGYEVAYKFSEVFSGLSLDRLKLGELRELVRNERIEVLIVYSLDRLSRDPTHGVILTQEMEKHGVKLEAVTEDVDSSELGKLISYIRGFASKLEAEKIRERTVRGRLARAKEGRACGNFGRIYGYDYIKTGKEGGRRIINESEAEWVRKMFHWLVEDRISTAAIRDRLVALNVPTKAGHTWRRSTITTILKNPGYCGKTYAFTADKGKLRGKPQEDWIELPDITPPIINKELYDEAQKQLQTNRDRAMRNTRHEYLLRSRVKCRRCGHSYGGNIHGRKRKDGSYRRVYLCGGRSRDIYPSQRCYNKIWNADKLEAIVWSELEHRLNNSDLIVSELEKQQQSPDRLERIEAQLKDVQRQLKSVEREQAQLLQWALKGFPENQVESENRRLNKTRESLKAQEAELESQVKDMVECSIDVPKLESFIKNIQGKLSNLDYEGKQLALEMLHVTVWIDGDDIEVKGAIDPEYDIVTTPS